MFPLESLQWFAGPSDLERPTCLADGDDYQVFGREAERDAILDFLLTARDDSDGVGVIPVVGFGGMGKTALARLIFSDGNVNVHFDARMWIHVSPRFDLTNIVKQMLGNLEEAPLDDDSNPEAVKENLRRRLEGKRFFVVFDDVWDELVPEWEAQLQSLLAVGAPGSAVLVTTQSHRVAKLTGNVASIHLDVLQDDEYWRLFEHFAFTDCHHLDEERLQKLRLIGRKIAMTMLRGLPLAGKAIGRLLCSRLEEDYWTQILHTKWWDLNVDILPSLGLTFHHLEVNLKACLLYCSIFPRGYVFEKEKLVQMWMAQGFIRPDGQRRAEDIGSQLFDELTERSFFQPAHNNRYVMDDLMQELAVYVSLDECYILQDESNQVPKTIHHLSIRGNRLDLLGDMRKYEKLRTVLFFGYYEPQKFIEILIHMFEKCEELRVLDLSCNCTDIKMLPDSIGGLRCLQYLDISDTKIEKLPESFVELLHMQTLYLWNCRFKTFPEGMNRLINLRHLYADGDTLSLIPGIGKLTCLQELEEFRVEKKTGYRIGELKELTELRGHLLIENLGSLKKKETVEAKLMDKQHLDALSL